MNQDMNAGAPTPACTDAQSSTLPLSRSVWDAEVQRAIALGRRMRSEAIWAALHGFRGDHAERPGDAAEAPPDRAVPAR